MEPETVVCPRLFSTANLPDMQGSGMVRDMREAASLNKDFATALTQYHQAATREEQLAQIDNLLAQWAKSSGWQDMKARAVSNGYTVEYFQNRTAANDEGFGMRRMG